MRHRNHSNRLPQKPHHSRMIKRNLVTSILLYERVRTTKKRAQVVRPIVDRVVTIAKGPNEAVAIRRINQIVTDKNACRKLMEVLKDRFSARTSGYTKMVPVGMRKGDGAMLVDLMFVDAPKETAPVADAPKKKEPKAEKAAPKKTAAKKTSSKKSS